VTLRRRRSAGICTVDDTIEIRVVEIRVVEIRVVEIRMVEPNCQAKAVAGC